MSWGAGVYGDPCAECGFSWGIDLEDACEVIAAIPERYRALTNGRDGHERHPDLSWSVTAYVCHVADNYAIWGERLMGAARSGQSEVAPYDENELAAARRYGHVALEGALWSLEIRTPQLLDAIASADRAGVELDHPERGVLAVVDVAGTVAHDAYHHEWDLIRSITS